MTIINSFEELVRNTESFKNKYLFRGQSNKDWGIHPSLFRNDTLLNNEADTIINELGTTGNDVISTMFKLQHYGTPTRLLDLTISPLSALFFAIDDKSQEDCDGVIYIIDKTKAIACASREIKLFSIALLKQDMDLDDIKNESISENDIRSVLTKDYIIEYDYNFSYTNHRAMLQGGTALLFGFDINHSKFQRKSSRSIEYLIAEKIIIPSSLKAVLKEKLERLGYSRSILYEAFENGFDSCEIIMDESEFKLIKRPDFKKIVAK